MPRGSGAERLPGETCYDLFAGTAAIAAIRDEEPGTFFLTDFLVRTFDHLVWRGLGLDRYPDLRDTTSATTAGWCGWRRSRRRRSRQAAEAAAAKLGLPLEVRETGEAGLARSSRPRVNTPSVARVRLSD